MRRGPQGNVDRNARIVRMVEGGQTYTDTAAAMGVTRNVVAGVCSRAGCVVGPENRADRMRNSPRMNQHTNGRTEIARRREHVNDLKRRLIELAASDAKPQHRGESLSRGTAASFGDYPIHANPSVRPRS